MVMDDMVNTCCNSLTDMGVGVARMKARRRALSPLSLFSSYDGENEVRGDREDVTRGTVLIDVLVDATPILGMAPVATTSSQPPILQ